MQGSFRPRSSKEEKNIKFVLPVQVEKVKVN